MSEKASEIEGLVMRSLTSSDRLTLMQITAVLPEELRGCPDEVARVLARLRRKGAIAGQFSEQDSAWVYWRE